MPYKDPDKRKKHNRDYYERHKDRDKEMRRASNKRSLEKLVSWINEIKSNPCFDCGRSYPSYVMDFHHRNKEDKKDSVSVLVKQRASKQRILNEIEKCDLVCANCHRERHYGVIA